MSDTPLLVPMPVQALLVNDLVRKDPRHQFRRWNAVYSSLNDFQDPIPVPFENEQQNPPGAGVHLHWKLPSAITHGRGRDTESVEFHLAPNRWIVMRLATTAGATEAPELTAWIIESDFLDPVKGTSAFADPWRSTADSAVPTKIGRSVPIAEWKSDPNGKMFLDPTGVADVTFTAYHPNVENVFAFHDDTTGLPEHTLLTYLVAGWYSDASRDPLATMTPDALNWQVLGALAEKPSRTIAHGLVYGLEWQTKRIPPRVDADASGMQVAVGYTAVDALSAIVAANAGGGQAGAELQAKLQAFQYDVLATLDAEDGMAQLEQRIRRAWFGTTTGGTRWEIAAVSQGQDSEERIDDATVPPPVTLTAAQAQWLADLNVRQRDCDRMRRDLQTMRWELFALWWKSKRAAVIVNDPALLAAQQDVGVDITVIQGWIQQALDTTNAQGAARAVTDLQDQVAGRAAKLPDPVSAESIAQWSREIPASPPPANGGQPVPLALKPVALPSFAQPADPVLLVAGVTPPTNEVDDRVALPCRGVDAAVTGVKVGTTDVTASTGSLGSIIRLPPVTALPAAVGQAVMALGTEAFFADPNNAASIVVNGTGASDADVIESLADAMARGTAQRASVDRPLRASFAFARWRQAWSPVYLQWQLTWFPTVEPTPSGPSTPSSDAQYPAGSGGAQDNFAFQPAAWHFDGGDDVTARGSEYYSWTGGDPWTSGKPKTPTKTYVGRTFLTPQATFLFLRRLADYAALHPDDPDLHQLETLIQSVGETRFLSQTLSGFNAAFAMHGLRHAPSPTGDIGNAIAGENRGVPMVELGDGSFDFGTGTPFFFPVRGGFFQFERLQIVDAFGQLLDLMAANGNVTGDVANFFPIRGPGLVSDADSGIGTPARRIQQAPRIVQPARLRLLLLDANTDSKEVHYAAGANPVCGWLLPNHLDRSIAVYDAAGNAAGEMLVLADESGERVVRWLPAPGVATPLTDPGQLDNEHLRAMLSAFTTTTGGIPADQRVDAFLALYHSIDETLWMVDPPGTQGDQDLAALIGRPLAVVRAQLRFELFGRPATNQSWRDTLQRIDAALTTFSFPIRLGSTELLNDGLIGYFTTERYTRFEAVHPSATSTSPYVAPIAPGNYPSLAFDHPAYTPLTLTLLMDPRAAVHATTGILPTTTLELPAAFRDEALARMAVTFRTGPVLTQPDVVRVPIPAERNGAWSWVFRTGTGERDYDTSVIVAANAQARLPDSPPHLVDGWLRFTPNKGVLRTGGES